MHTTDKPHWTDTVKEKYGEKKVDKWKVWAEDWVTKKDPSIMRAIQDGRIASIEHAIDIVCELWLANGGKGIQLNTLSAATSEMFPGRDAFT